VNESYPNRFMTKFCLLAATAMPIIFFGTQIAAAPFYPEYSFSEQSISMLGTSFSERPWIFNAGETLTGITALAAALGLFQVFLRKTNFLVGGLIGFAVACIGIMAVKAGTFPMPNPHHNSWEVLQNFIIITPHLMLLGLWNQKHTSGLRTYLILCIALLVLLVPLGSRLGRGTLQRLISAATLVPVGIVGFSFWRELRREAQDKSI
jgi:hypothetical membrane protein